MALAASPEQDYRDGDRSFRRGDVVAAMKQLARAADAGHTKAQVLLAFILDQSGYDREAAERYRQGVAAGSADAEYGLAGMHLAGEGVERDLERAMALFRSAASRGHGPSTVALAQAYLNGTLAADGDAANVGKLLERAAELGHAPALLALARGFEEGAHGLQPDAQRAGYWKARHDAATGATSAAATRR
ncbi:MAG: sel1 repeat family protein [Burkholderiales bacterium]|nr:MAG: sel1 repeat family protein [Burkholderiales bacterium]